MNNLEQTPKPTSDTNIPKRILLPLLFFTFLTIAFKWGFEYYNLLIPIILICILIFSLKKYRPSKNRIMIIWALFSVNILCLVIPDRAIYKLKNDRYFWSEAPLEVSHFNIRRNVESDTAATVNPTVIGAISKVYNYPPAILFASDNKEFSWFDISRFTNSEEDKELLKQLLEHEKRHLDIMEIYIRRAQDSLSKMVFCSYHQKYEVVEHFFELSEKEQREFDAETENGTIDEKVKKWNKTITEQLLQNNF